MTNFENIDNYLANRLQPGEKEAFEKALASDPALKEEVAFQERVIQAVRDARAADLKHMLQQLPVPSTGYSAGQVAAGVFVAGLVATGLYFYLGDRDTAMPAEPTVVPEVVTSPEPTSQPAEEPSTPETVAPAPVEKEEKKKAAASPATKEVKPVQKPDIQVVDPSVDLTESKEPASVTTPAREELTVSKLEVLTTPANKKYNFHYQFTEGKLMLFGPFDKSLYEILEINGAGHAVFLFYRENYYLLDESKTEVTKLSVIRDSELLKKLKEYRNR